MFIKNYFIIMLIKVFFCLFVLVSQSYAQSQSGNINGTVFDAQGAVVAGAIVDVSNKATGEKRSTSSDNDGLYFISNLLVGTYDLKVSARGFSTTEIKNIKVSVSFNTVVKIELSIGVSDAITVTVTNVLAVNTTDQQVSTLIEENKIKDLPLLSRDPTQLILLAPGVIRGDILGGFSINGSRQTSNNFHIDGLDNNDPIVPGDRLGSIPVDIDSVQEFRIIAHNFNAEYGRSTGAIINVTTKTGTNEFHGGLYYYYQANQLSARNFFSGNTSIFNVLTKDSQVTSPSRDQIGGTIGGPIKKDKLFFFFGFQADRISKNSPQFRTVPTAEARQGILNGTEFGNLDLRQGSPNNINNFSFSLVTSQILNSIFPLPNTDSVFDDKIFGVYLFDGKGKVKSILPTSRIDYKLNSNHNIYGRYSVDTRNFVVSDEGFPGLGDNTRAPQRSQSFSINLSSILTSNVVNNFRIGINRLNVGGGSRIGSTLLDNKVKAAFKNTGISPEQLFGGGNKRIILGISSFTDSIGFNIGNGVNTDYRITGTSSLTNITDYSLDSHNLKAGVESRFVYTNLRFNDSGEILKFGTDLPLLKDKSGMPIDIDSSAQEYAAFLYGLVSSQKQTQFFNKELQQVNSKIRGYRIRETEGFIQDSWRILPNLNLNYGLRYEFKGVPYEVNGNLSALVDQAPSDFIPDGGFVFQLVGKNSPNENIKLYDNDLNNFAPRFGFAYDPFNKGNTSIRGGYGIFYDSISGIFITDSQANPPFDSSFERNFNGFVFLPNIPRPTMTSTKNYTLNNGDLGFATIFPIKGKKGNNPYQRELRIPYIQSFNLGIQHQLTPTVLIEVDYIGSKSTKLLRTIDGTLASVKRRNIITGENNDIFNATASTAQLNTAFNNVKLYLTTAFSTYHAVAFRVTKVLKDPRYGLGEIQAVYNFSHSIDNASAPLISSRFGSDTKAFTQDSLNFGNKFPFGTPSSAFFPVDSSGFEGGFNKPERGNSDFDVRHRLVVNFIYELPFKFNNRLFNTLLGNFSVSGIAQLQSGKPFSVFYDKDTQGTRQRSYARFALSGNTAGNSDALGAVGFPQTGPSAGSFQDVGAILEPGIGNVPRNFFVGPRFSQFDVSVFKVFKFQEIHQLQLRVDVFNLPNKPNFVNPNNIIERFAVGRSTQAFDPRILQFSLRYSF